MQRWSGAAVRDVDGFEPGRYSYPQCQSLSERLHPGMVLRPLLPLLRLFHLPRKGLPQCGPCAILVGLSGATREF
jgi:hypothetical protein